jgi:hypothetical protein
MYAVIVATEPQGRGLSDRKSSCKRTCQTRVHFKHKVSTATIITKGPSANTRHRLPTPRRNIWRVQEF